MAILHESSAMRQREALANYRRPSRTPGARIRDEVQRVNLGMKKAQLALSLKGISSDNTVGVISSEHNREGGSRCVSLV